MGWLMPLIIALFIIGNWFHAGNTERAIKNTDEQQRQQQVYEILLDKPLLKANFRRKIADMVIETDEYEENTGHRPSKLYCFNKNWQPHIF